jgi:hypothetical protein
VLFKYPGECARAAELEEECGELIEWSDSQNKITGCSCCVKADLIPSKADDAWNTYCVKTEAIVGIEIEQTASKESGTAEQRNSTATDEDTNSTLWNVDDSSTSLEEIFRKQA